MPVTRSDAARIAALARLELSGAELDRAAGELAAIVAYVEQIAAIDTAGIDLTPPSGPSALRDDEPAPSLSAEDAFANAPDVDRDARLFRVPRVMGS